MHEVKAIIRPERLDAVLHALHEMVTLPGVTISEVRGIGRRTDRPASDEPEYGDTRLAKLEVVVPRSAVEIVVNTIESVARTGRPGDGKIFVSPVSEARRVRTGERDERAL